MPSRRQTLRHRLFSMPARAAHLDFWQPANSAKIALFAILTAMKRDQMLMEAILGKFLEAPEPHLTVTGIAQRLNAEQAVILHHLHLLEDKGWVAESESGFWRLTNAGHDYLDGTPQQGISLKSLG